MMTVSFASLAYENKKKKTRREKFLEEMDKVIPWNDLLEEIKRYYPRVGNGRQPMPLKMMLKIYFMQQWYKLSDPAMEDALYDSESLRRFADIDIAETLYRMRARYYISGICWRSMISPRRYLKKRSSIFRIRDCYCEKAQ